MGTVVTKPMVKLDARQKRRLRRKEVMSPFNDVQICCADLVSQDRFSKPIERKTVSITRKIARKSAATKRKP